MQTNRSVPAENLNPLRNPPDFSLVLGGPFFQFLRRAHLTDDALMLVRQRVIVLSLLAWLPLLALSALEGQMLGGSVAVPFLFDVVVHVRFLVAMPLLIVAELVVHQRTRELVQQFLERNLIPESAMTRFDAAITSAIRWRNSVLAEALLIAFVYTLGITVIWRGYMALDTATWYATSSVEGARLSLAGMWYAYVSLPLFQFLLVRWYFRILIWARFLWQVSRIELHLVPTHPDGAGGLGFLPYILTAFVPLMMAHGALLAGELADRILHLGARLPDFMIEILLLVVFLLGVIFGPLLVFTPQLVQAKWTGRYEYGALAQRYVREFDAKWLHGRTPADEPLLGSSDIQSLADLKNSLDVVRSMSVTLVTKDAILVLVVATLAPIAPLLLTMMPLEDLLKKLLGILF